MAKKYYKRKQEILSLEFPYFGTAFANYGQFAEGGLLTPEKPEMTDLGEINDTNIARNLKFPNTNTNQNKGFDIKSLSGISNVGNTVNNYIDENSTDPRGFQDPGKAALSGGLRGGLNGLELGMKTGNPFIAAGAAALGAGIGIYKDVTQSKKQNKEAAANLANFYAQSPGANSTSANPYKIANGGYLQNGGPMDENFNAYNGNSHEEGGLPIGQNNEVEGGEVNYKNYVFSDRLTPEDKKSTFANLAKRVRGKYKEREYDQAASRAMEQELTKLMQQNEQARIIKEAQDKHLQELEGLRQQFKNGGFKDPLGRKFGTPGRAESQEFLNSTEPVNENTNFDINKYNSYKPNEVVPEFNYEAWKATQDKYKTNVEGNSTKVDPTKQKSKFGSEEAALGLSMLPAIYNNIKGAKASRTSFAKATPELINLEAERYALKNEGAKARLIAGQNVRNIGGGSGSSLAGLAAAHSAISSNVMEGLSRSYQNEANTNVGIKNQFSSMNTGIRNQEIVANEQNQAMSDSLKSLGLSDLSRNAQSYLKDKSLKKENLRSNDERTNLINQLFPNYVFNKDPETDKLVVKYINTYYNGK